jgi:hypothetical protein
MEQNVIQKNMWNTAAKAGLVLGLVSAVYMFITRWTGQSGMPGFAGMLINGALWCIKFAGCIWLMMFFMKKFVAEYPESDNASTRRLGVSIAFLSALVYSAVCLADITFISPDFYTDQIDQVMQQYASILDSNTLNEVEGFAEKLPQLIFFSNLIYCFIYGVVLSAILSRNIPSRNPFSDNKPDEQ